MGKIAFVFPGQGSQYKGMGQDFFEKYDTAKEVYNTASNVTGIDVKALCFEENEKLNITEYTQLAMLTTEVAILKVIEERGIKADVCAGLSLGEYAALAASKVMNLKDLFHIIRKRGLYMQEAYPTGGAMSAVLGMENDKVKELCEQTDGIVEVANYNCPGQVVISGEKTAVENASQRLSEAGAKRCIPLNVSGPFHSSLLKGAGAKLELEFDNVEINKPEIPYVCNVSATCVEDSEDIKNILVKQVSNSVRWQQSVEKMIEDGVDTFVEIGPGKTLTGFLKKINKDAKGYNVATVEDLERVLEEFAC